MGLRQDSGGTEAGWDRTGGIEAGLKWDCDATVAGLNF